MKLPIIAVLGVSFFYAQASFAEQAAKAAVAPAPVQTKSVAQAPIAALPSQGTALVSQKDKVSYSIGVDLGENFKTQGIDIDAAMLAKGLQDALTNHATLITKQEMTATLLSFQKELMAKRDAQNKTLSTKNLQDSNAYLAANKNKPGVITTASGVQYKVINTGKGESPVDNDVVTVDYKGTFIDGKVFDSSYDRKQSATFPLSGVIPGWQEVLKLMKPGATYEVVLPPNLAYGERGMGNAIGPNQALLFTIHLVSVKKTV